MSADSDSDIQDGKIIKKFIPEGRQLLPTQYLLSVPPKFIAYSKTLFTQNHFCKFEPLGEQPEIIQENQDNINIAQAFKNPIYQRFKSLQIFDEEHLNFNFLRYLLDNKFQKIQNPRNTKKDYSNDLLFDSEFQSGNLAKVSKIADNQYNLLIQNDINTFGYTQWFFFKVKNSQKINVKFNIINMYKRKSLYQHGMKLAVFSTINFKRGIGWQRGGENISYYTNNYVLSHKKYQTLTWTYNFIHENDQVFFAYNYPYTYSDLNDYLDSIQKMNLNYVKRGILCTTISKNRVDYLSITEPVPTTNKKFILISARVHPGQTVSSFMMKGIIDHLISPQAASLRQKYVFRLIPMLNPDGVINGNYRCSLAGRDLNRRWKKPSKQLYPQIYHFKKMILKISKENRLELFCDLHGHSTKKSIFYYGCQHLENPYQSRQFPFIMSKLTKNVNFESCNFKTQKNKIGTARVALYQATKLPRIYTIQSSFCGPLKQQYQYTPKDFQDEGKCVCKGIQIYYTLKSRNRKVKVDKSIDKKSNRYSKEKSAKSKKQQQDNRKRNNKTQLKQYNQKKSTIQGQPFQQHLNILNQLYQSNQLLNVGNNDTSGSDSDPSIDQAEEKYIIDKNFEQQQRFSKKNSVPSLVLNRIPHNKLEKQDRQRQAPSLPFIKQQQKQQKPRNFVFDFRQRRQLKKLQLIRQSNSGIVLKRNFTSDRMPVIKKNEYINEEQATKRYKSKQNKKSLQLQDIPNDLNLISIKSSLNDTLLLNKNAQSNIQVSIKNHLQTKIRKRKQNESTIIKINDMGIIDPKLLKNKQLQIKLPFTINLIFQQQKEELLDTQILKKLALSKIKKKNKMKDESIIDGKHFKLI